jgi:hypothetical protein
METNPTLKSFTRREILLAAAGLTGGALAARFFPAAIVHASAPGFPQQPSAADRVAAMRAQFGGLPIQAQPLTDNLTLLSGPGGNVVVLNGADGKLMGDTFVQPAWPHLKDALATIGNAPVKTAIDTHWHFDHSDNNASLRAAGATLVAHENTKKRMSETHTLAVLNLTFPPSPAEALPQQTFKSRPHIRIPTFTFITRRVMSCSAATFFSTACFRTSTTERAAASAARSQPPRSSWPSPTTKPKSFRDTARSGPKPTSRNIATCFRRCATACKN